MTDLLSILLSDIVPIFAIAAIGYVAEQRLSGSAKVLSALTFNVLSPSLIFVQLVTSSMSGADAGRMAGFYALLTFIMGFIARLAAGPLGLHGKTRTSFLLTVMFSNSGNYALPVILFAFGRDALAFASVYFVTSAVVLYTVGILIASHEGGAITLALRKLLKVPAIYSLAAAMLIIVSGTSIPVGVMRPIGMLGDAAIPMMLLGLGVQLRRATFPSRPAGVVVATALSLLVSPIIGTALATLLGLSGTGRDTAIVVSAMPAAVVTTVLAQEFDLDSSFITSVVFVSTLLSPITLVLLIAYLK